MKLFLIIGFLCLSITLCFSHYQSSEESSEESEHGHGHHGHHDKCKGLEDVDLSDLSLEIEEVRKFISKDENSNENELDSTLETAAAEISLADIKTSIKENGMGVIRKVVILPSKKKIYAKVQKTSSAKGDFTTSVSGSMNSSFNTVTEGKATFGADITVIAARAVPGVSISGDVNINSNSTTKVVKKGWKNIIETKSSADSETKITWSVDANAGSMTAKTFSSSTIGTIILSKKCFATGVVMGFNTSASGDDWTSNIVGKGKGGVYSRILYATANGTSVSWTFAKVIIKTHLNMKGGNWSVDGSQYITIKSFTETVTRPANASAENAELNLEVSNEIKIRVGVSTKLSNGAKIYSTGGQILFRNSKMNIPKFGTESHENVEIEGESEEEVEGARLMMGSSFRRQVQGEETLAIPSFVNSVITSAMN